MSRHVLLSVFAVATCATAAQAQLPRTVLRDGMAIPSFTPFAPAPAFGLNATTAPHSAPGSIFPGPGPMSSPASPFFFSSSNRPFFPIGLYAGGLYPWYYPDYDYYEYSRPLQAPVMQILPEYVDPTITVARSSAIPWNGFAPATPENPTRAKLTLNVPESAEVWINGEKTKLTGAQRVFESPELASGKNHTFDTRVVWSEGDKQVEEQRKLTLQAGESKSLTYVAAPPAQARLSR
jgi:uncharacterized protein (TIGR03000 family)